MKKPESKVHKELGDHMALGRALVEKGLALGLDGSELTQHLLTIFISFVVLAKPSLEEVDALMESISNRIRLGIEGEKAQKPP